MVTIQGRISPEGRLTGTIAPNAALSGKISSRTALSGRLSPFGVLRGAIAAPVVLTGSLTIATGAIPAYHGPTEITPCEATQVVPCAGLIMPANVIIDAIPSNYGRIGWDGVTLSVS